MKCNIFFIIITEIHQVIAVLFIFRSYALIVIVQNKYQLLFFLPKVYHICIMKNDVYNSVLHSIFQRF